MKELTVDNLEPGDVLADTGEPGWHKQLRLEGAVVCSGPVQVRVAEDECPDWLIETLTNKDYLNKTLVALAKPYRFGKGWLIPAAYAYDNLFLAVARVYLAAPEGEGE